MSSASGNSSSESPFQVQVAERVTRLPPYLFGRINALLYNKRRAGDDVIDLGMGNPSDPPEDFDHDPCTWYWYKDPADIPARHFERYGLERGDGG